MSTASGSPFKFKGSSVQLFSATALTAQERRDNYVLEMQNKFVCMNSDTFLKTFVPSPKKGNGEERQVPDFSGVFDAMLACSSEDEMYGAFAKCVEKGRMCPKYKFVSTPYQFQSDDNEKRKVDAGLYLKKQAPKFNGQPRWEHIPLYAEFKSQANSSTCDPLDDRVGKPDEPDAETRREARGQIISYAAAVYARQQRVFLFSLIILGHSARIIRWDRSGAIYTEKFNYVAHPSILASFLWRFTYLSPTEQGHDPTAILIQPQSTEYKAMLKKANDSMEEDYKRKYFQRSLDNEWPWWKLRVQVEEESSAVSQSEAGQGPSRTGEAASVRSNTSTKFRDFLVGKPHFQAVGMTGRGTRGYVALDCETEELVFLKDAWRVQLAGMQKEGDVLRLLKKSDVKHIPTLVCHGDVEGQRTRTQDEWEGTEDEWEGLQNPLKTHAHYRLVVKEIGCPLAEFSCSRELVRALFHCLIAHRGAYTNAHILHRDVSAGNILIVRHKDGDTYKSEGLLNDWDLSKNTDDDKYADPRQPDRTGTWQFMSGLLLEDVNKRHELSDDLESFIHVLIWHAVRYLGHNCESIGPFMANFFDWAQAIGQVIRGGEFKIKDIALGRPKIASPSGGMEWLEFDNPHLNNIIHTAFSWFRALYSTKGKLGTIFVSAVTESDDETRCITVIDDDDDLLSEAHRGLTVERRQKDVSADADTKILADSVQTHDQIIALFTEVLIDTKDWLEDDKTSDQLPKGYRQAGLKLPSTKRTSQTAGLDFSEAPVTKAPRASSSTFQRAESGYESKHSGMTRRRRV